MKEISSLFSLMESFVHPPDLLIYLKSTVSNLVTKIQSRGRNYEESIRIDYLNRLNERYEAPSRYFSTCSFQFLVLFFRDKE